MQSRSISMFNYYILLLPLLSTSLYSTLTLGIDPKHEFNYIKGSRKGPLRWGYLKPEWVVCKIGRMQSPVDISFSDVKPLPILGEVSKNYNHATGKLTKIQDVQIDFKAGNAGSILVDGATFNLVDFHWHAPSEHTINEERSLNLELHMVHKNVDPKAVKKFTIIAHLYRIGDSDPFLSALTRKIVTYKSKDSFLVNVDPSEVKSDFLLYYRYMGSLTTPPCSEHVTWIVDHSISSVSAKEVKILRQAIGDMGEGNARPLQSINNRKILLGALIKGKTFNNFTYN